MDLLLERRKCNLIMRYTLRPVTILPFDLRFVEPYFQIITRINFHLGLYFWIIESIGSTQIPVLLIYF